MKKAHRNQKTKPVIESIEEEVLPDKKARREQKKKQAKMAKKEKKRVMKEQKMDIE